MSAQVARAFNRERRPPPSWKVVCAEQGTISLEVSDPRAAGRTVLVKLAGVAQVERWLGQALVSLAFARLAAPLPEAAPEPRPATRPAPLQQAPPEAAPAPVPAALVPEERGEVQSPAEAPEPAQPAAVPPPAIAALAPVPLPVPQLAREPGGVEVEVPGSPAAPLSVGVGLRLGGELAFVGGDVAAGGDLLLGLGAWRVGVGGWGTSKRVSEGTITAAGGWLIVTRPFEPWASGPWSLRLGPSAAAGLGWIGAEPAAGQVAQSRLAPLAALGGEGGVQVALGETLSLSLTVQVRWCFGVIGTVDGRDALSFNGPMAGVSLGTWWRLR